MNTPMHRLTLGDFELTAISDGIYHLDGGVFFGVVPKVMWERKVKADEKNLVPSGLNSVVVRTSKKTVLIETGLGNKLPERLVKNYGQPSELLTNLTAAGTSPEDIDIVINTHLHFDHCGWNTVRKGDKVVATFPNAQYYVQEGEWQHARQQHERGRDPLGQGCGSDREPERHSQQLRRGQGRRQHLRDRLPGRGLVGDPGDGPGSLLAAQGPAVASYAASSARIARSSGR